MKTAMSAINQTFSWSRFVRVVNKEFTMNGRTLGLTLAAIYLFFAFWLTATNVATRGMKGLDLDPMVLFLLIAIIASMGFNGLRSKGKRADYLAMPASTAEKFTYNAMFYVIGGVLAVVACIYLADLTRIAVLWFKRGDDFLVPGPTAFAETVVKWVDMDGNAASCLPEFLLNCLWYASMFMLGSILWPKNTFLKTALLVLAYWVIMAYMHEKIVYSNAMTSDGVMRDIKFGVERFKQFMLIVDCITIIVCWVGGWYLFKKKDVISLKWWKK